MTDAPKTILDKGPYIKAKLPGFFRIPGKKEVRFRFYTPVSATYERIGQIIVRSGLRVADIGQMSTVDVYEIFGRHGKQLCTAVSIAVLNDPLLIFLFGKLLARYISCYCDKRDILAVIGLVHDYGGLSHFMDLVRDIRNRKVK